MPPTLKLKCEGKCEKVKVKLLLGERLHTHSLSSHQLNLQSSERCGQKQTSKGTKLIFKHSFHKSCIYFQDPLELHAMTWNPGIHLSDWSQNCWYFRDRSGCTILWMSGENMQDLWKECLKINLVPLDVCFCPHLSELCKFSWWDESECVCNLSPNSNLTFTFSHFPSHFNFSVGGISSQQSYWHALHFHFFFHFHCYRYIFSFLLLL
jgi:hypothetical protein